LTTIPQWLSAWQLAKDAEDAAKDARLTAELQILALLEKPENFKGSVKLDGVTVTYGETVKVDAEQLQSLVNHPKVGHYTLGKLFRWKAELVAKEWKAAPEEIQRILSGALETKPSKPSFSRIIEKGNK
jgi:hypothetical protein